jgi:diadenosine tetraphosphate (Ap4A) HIT family hydrolase
MTGEKKMGELLACRAMTCVFCRIAAGEPSSFPILLDTADTVVMLHDDWAVRGHAMVVAKRHVENLADLTADEAAGFTAVWHHAERVLLDVTGADRSIALKLGIVTPHLHLHLYPVAATLDRAAVQAILDAKTRDSASEQEQSDFVGELRRRLGTFPSSPFPLHPSPQVGRA